jgi:hypothetical protein
MREVTDPALLEKLNASAPKEVTDPALLRELEGGLSGTARGYRLVDAAGEPGIPEQFLGGAKHALDRTAAGLEGAARFVGNKFFPDRISTDLSPETQRLLEQGGAFVKETGPASTVGQIGGDVALSLAPLARAAQGARVLTKALGVAPTAVPAADVAANAGYAALTTPEDRGSAALWGGGGAAGGRVLSKALGGGLRSAATPEAEELLKRGVALTPGQAAGPRSLIGRIEDALSSNPVVGWAVNPARRRGIDEANLALVNTVVSDVGGAINKGTPVREALDLGYDTVSRAYQEALEGAKFTNKPAGENLHTYIRSSLNSVIGDSPLLSDSGARELSGYAASLKKRLPFGDVDGATLKQIDAEVGYMARQLEKSPDPRDKISARAWREFQQDWRDGVLKVSQASDAKRELLGRANQAYKELLALDKAKGVSETIAPRRLVKTLADRGIPSSRPTRQVANAMEATLPNALPNTGTAERLITAALPSALLGGGAGLNLLGDPFGLGTMAVASGLAMSRPGTRALMGQLPVQGFARRSAAEAAQIGRAAAMAAKLQEDNKRRAEEQRQRVIEQAEAYR